MPQPTYLDPRALAARNPWFSEEPYRSRQLSAAQQDRLEHALDDDLPDVMDEIATELDAEAEAMPVMPEGMQRLLRDFANDCFRHAERQMPVPTFRER